MWLKNKNIKQNNYPFCNFAFRKSIASAAKKMIINKNVINTKKYANGTPEMTHGFEINHGVFE